MNKQQMAIHDAERSIALSEWGIPLGGGANLSFENWQKTKRDFTKSEITSGFWVKVGKNGQALILYLHEDGNVTEKPLFSSKEWGGSWELTDGMLLIKIDIYETAVVASKEEPIHSAMQFEKSQPHTFFKFIHAG
jgi:hypothetical protein